MAMSAFDERPAGSQSAIYVEATQLVSDLRERASLDVSALLQDLVEGAAQTVPGALHAGITVTQRRRAAETVAASDRYPVELDEIQNQCQQGPCLAAASSQQTVRVDDLARDPRWPDYCREVRAQTPIRSVLSLALLSEGSTAASLNLFGDRAHAFDDHSVQIGLTFASHAALAWIMMRRDQQFRAALVSRDLIGQAKGRMMERFDIDAAEAFETLKVMSQDTNTPLAAVAQRVVAGEVWSSDE